MNNLSLVYVNPIGENSDGLFEYEFFFSATPENIWGDNWECIIPADCDDITPDDYEIHKERLISEVPLFCAQQNTCFSMEQCTNNVIAIAFEDLTNYEFYPEPYRIVFQYGETYNSVMDKLHGRELYFASEQKENTDS